MPPWIRRVAHVNLSVDDVEKARAFYGDLLGLLPATRPADAGRAGHWFRAGAGAGVELHLSEDSISTAADNHSSKRHVALVVDDSDFDALRDHLAQAGVPIEDARPLPGVRRFFARDPAGNRIELTTETTRD